jgi:1,6-anhydro-N-acetylmuramate kinase
MMMQPSTVTNLGAQLKQIRQRKLDSVNQAQQAKIQAAYERSQAERAQIQNWWLDIFAKAVSQINQGQEPSPRQVPSYVMQQGRPITHELHSHHDIWINLMLNGSRTVGLTPVFNYVDDGMGRHSWYVISFDPIQDDVTS